MAHFNKVFLDFFSALSKNNTSEWFNDNRKLYEAEVKKPFANFVDVMIARIQEHEPEVAIKAGDAIFRINKDIRFSKDKSPYNTHVSANISKFGRKDKAYPGFYFQLSNTGVKVMGGAYVLEPAVLLNVRTYIAANMAQFKKAYADKSFTGKFGTLQGEQHKKLAGEFHQLLAKEPLIANKQFYYTADIDAKACLKDDFADQLMECYKAGKNMNQFLREAIG